MFAPDPTTMEANFKLSLDFKRRLLASLMQNAVIKYCILLNSSRCLSDENREEKISTRSQSHPYC